MYVCYSEEWGKVWVFGRGQGASLGGGKGQGACLGGDEVGVFVFGKW